MPFSTTIANALLARFHAQAGTTESPSNLWVGLHVGNPGGDGQAGLEVSGGAYARVPFDDWTTAAGRLFTNNSAITWATATASWGKPDHVTLWKHATSQTAANFCGYGSLLPALPVPAASIAKLDTGIVKISMPG